MKRGVLFSAVFLFILSVAVNATEMGETIINDLENADTTDPESLGSIYKATVALEPFLNEGLITQEEYDKIKGMIGKLAGEWLNNTVNG